MTREEFEHVVKAAAAIAKDELVVVGSQSVLAQFPDAPPSLLRSHEVDVYPKSNPDQSERIDGAIGDGSMFHSTYGYYAHGVGPETITAPAGTSIHRQSHRRFFRIGRDCSLGKR